MRLNSLGVRQLNTSKMFFEHILFELFYRLQLQRQLFAPLPNLNGAIEDKLHRLHTRRQKTVKPKSDLLTFCLQLWLWVIQE